MAKKPAVKKTTKNQTVQDLEEFDQLDAIKYMIQNPETRMRVYDNYNYCYYYNGVCFFEEEITSHFAEEINSIDDCGPFVIHDGKLPLNEIGDGEIVLYNDDEYYILSDSDAEMMGLSEMYNSCEMTPIVKISNVIFVDSETLVKKKNP